LKDGLSIAERFLDEIEATFQTLGHNPLIGAPHAKTFSDKPATLESSRIREFYDFLSSTFQRN